GSGFFSIPTTYGHSAAMICCLAISALFLRYRPFKGSTWFFVLAAALILLSIVTSYTRAAYISLTAAVAVMALLKSKKLFASSMAALLVLGGTFYTLNEGFRLRFNSIFNMQYDSNSERLNLWRAHFAMFKDYPLIGLGLHDNERRNPEYNVKLGQPNAFTGNAHNNYLQFLAGTGVIGFSLFMLFILYYLRLSANLWKRRDQFSLFQQTLILGIIGAQVSFHIAGLM